MEYKADMERAIVADFVKPSASQRYRSAIYALTALSSIFLGALAMALFYHWNEVQMINKRLQTQDVKDVIRMTDVLLTKHETNAANVEKLLTMFQHKLQSIESHLQPKMDDHFESNLTYDEANDSQQGNRVDGNKRAEVLKATVPASEGKIHQSNTVDTLTSAPVASIDGSDETKQPAVSAPHDEKQSAESFRWEMSFPQSAWLKLSPFGINYGTASEEE